MGRAKGHLRLVDPDEPTPLELIAPGQQEAVDTELCFRCRVCSYEWFTDRPVKAAWCSAQGRHRLTEMTRV